MQEAEQADFKDAVSKHDSYGVNHESLLILHSHLDLLILERYIRKILGCQSSSCTFLQSAEYITFKHSVSRWLTCYNLFCDKISRVSLSSQNSFLDFPKRIIHNIRIPNTDFLICQSIICPDNMSIEGSMQSSILQHLRINAQDSSFYKDKLICFVLIKNTALPLEYDLASNQCTDVSMQTNDESSPLSKRRSNLSNMFAAIEKSSQTRFKTKRKAKNLHIETDDAYEMHTKEPDERTSKIHRRNFVSMLSESKNLDDY